MTELIYAHCALRAPSRPAVTARWPRMPRGSAPRVLELGRGLWVIVSTVPGREYASELAGRLSDVDGRAGGGVAHKDGTPPRARGNRAAPFRRLPLSDRTTGRSRKSRDCVR